MNDLFTPDDRVKINAAMASGSGDRFGQLLSEHPNPSGGMTWGCRLGGIVVAVFVGGILAAILGLVGLAALVVLIVVAILLSGRIARWFHRRSLTRRAREEVVGGWAAQRGWQFVKQLPLANTTPLLRHGDRRETGWGITGQLDATTSFAAGAYQYEEDRVVVSTDSDGNTTTRTETDTYPFTIALISAPLPDLKKMQLRKGSTGGIFSKLSGAVSDLRPVPLESAEFNDQFHLMVADDADEIAIRMRFTPAVLMALVDRGAGESQIEAENGVLLVAREGAAKTDDFGELLDVLGDAVWFRSLLTDEPAGRVPDTAALRALLLGPAA
ncbi:MAG: hypothetical protein NTX95_01650 [Actinobacteria bacterium]|nr:hypothetical protein [Actinomycetota bacterium]